ncbi:MAG: hypothetical protein J0M04_23000 [Verrucomicrobia bacterium]|nr:hypothetical protein [Verrucomicrobiota bacterium]
MAGWLLASVSAVSADGWQIRGWHLEEGLPDGTITTMALGPDGCLWLGTPSGVVRFDGARFKRMDGIPEREIAGLAFDRDGALWIAGKSGRAFVYRNGKAGEVGGSVKAGGNPLSFPAWTGHSLLAPCASGGMWVWAERGDPVAFRADRPMDRDDWRGVAEGSVVAEASGSVWALRGNDLRRYDGERWFSHAIPGGALYEPACADPENGIWAIASGEGGRWLCHLSSEGAVVRRLSLPEGVGSEAKPVSSVLRDRIGGFWLSDWWGGIWHNSPDGGWEQIVHEGPLRRCVVTSLLEDRQGAVWVGTLGEGLHRISPHVAEMITPPGMDDRAVVIGVSGDPAGRLWIGVTDDGIYCHDSDGLRRYGEAEGLACRAVHAVFADRGGRIWTGTSEGAFLLESGRFERVDVAAGEVVTFYEDREGEMWMGGQGGTGALWHRDGGGVWRMLRPSEETVVLDIRGITRDSAGTVWVAAFGTGVWRVEGDSLVAANSLLGMARSDLRSVHADAQGGLWLGTLYGGLWHWHGGLLSRLSRADGLPDDSILGIADDGRGSLWFSSSNGVFGCARDSLAGYLPGGPPLLCWRVMPDDGLGNRGCSGGGQPVISRLGNDALCVANMIGAAIVRPGGVVRRGTGAEVRVESVLADGIPLETGTPVLTAPASVRRFEFEFTAPDLGGARNQRFRHRLEPLDREWLDAGAERSVSYSRLAPGVYQFRVMVGGADGVWRESAGPVVLRVTPRFWQTRWFAPAVVATAVSLIGLWGVWWTRSRMRRRVERLEMGHAIERERARIARDIHDDLGTSLTEILMVSETESCDPEADRMRLRRIGGRARTMIQTLDEIVWAVGPANDNLPKLVDYLCTVSEELCESAGVRCWHEVPVDLPMVPLAVDYRHQVFLAVKEAINNALKHAIASEIWLKLEVSGDHLHIAVEDDGIGFSRDGVAASGNGLTNMRARASAVGGRVEIGPASGGGVIVAFDLPLPSPP